jgi:antitoxin component YwqK of YwqJK toxin-antitoxin module
MVKKVIIYILLIPLIGCDHQKGDNKDLAIYGLRGHVRSLNEISFKAVDKFGVVQKESRGRQHLLVKDINVLFDKQGRLSELNNFDTQNNLLRKWIYKYEANSKLFEINMYHPDGKLWIKTSYVYDEKGLLIEKSDYLPDGTQYMNFKHKYDTNGKLIESASLYNGEVSNDYYIYDDKGNRIEETTKGKYFNDKSTYKYNSDNKVIERTSYYSDGRVMNKTTYHYDDLSNEIKMDSFGPGGELINNESYSYEFDKNKNWIKKTILINSIPKFIIERSISYF